MTYNAHSNLRDAAHSNLMHGCKFVTSALLVFSSGAFRIEFKSFALSKSSTDNGVLIPHVRVALLTCNSVTTIFSVL